MSESCGAAAVRYTLWTDARTGVIGDDNFFFPSVVLKLTDWLTDRRGLAHPSPISSGWINTATDVRMVNTELSCTTSLPSWTSLVASPSFLLTSPVAYLFCVNNFKKFTVSSRRRRPNDQIHVNEISQKTKMVNSVESVLHSGATMCNRAAKKMQKTKLVAKIITIYY